MRVTRRVSPCLRPWPPLSAPGQDFARLLIVGWNALDLASTGLCSEAMLYYASTIFKRLIEVTRILKGVVVVLVAK